MQLSLLNNFQKLSKSCDIQIQEAVARLYEEFKVRFYPIEEICCICRKKCSKIIHCNGSCNRYFGQKCLSKSSYDSYISSEEWECKLCIYNKSIKKTIMKTVDPNIENVLNALQITNFKALFYKIPFDTFKQYTLSDFCEMNIPLGPRLKLIKYLKELHFKTINYSDSSIDNLNNILKYPSKPFIDVTNQKIRNDEINSITPSMIVINSVSPFPDQMTKEELSNCSKFVRTLKQVNMKILYRLHRFHKPYNYEEFNRKAVEQFMRNTPLSYEPGVYKKKAVECLRRLENYVNYSEERCFNRIFTSHEVLQKIADFILENHIFEENDMYIDMSCGDNYFGSLLGVKYLGYDIFPPKYNYDVEHFSLNDWFGVYNLPNKGNCIIGLRPPCTDDYYVAKKFISHSFELFPKYVILYIPSSIKDKITIPDYFTLYLTQSIKIATAPPTSVDDEDSALPADAQDVISDDTLYIWKRNEKYIEAKNQQLKDKQQQYLLKQNQSQMKRHYNDYNSHYNDERNSKLSKHY